MAAHHTDSGSMASYLVPWLLITVLLAAYIGAVIQQKRAAKHWSNWRTGGFILGCGLLIVAMSPELVKYAHHDLRGHMIQHLLVGMLAPLGLVLAAPVTLALRALPVHASRSITAILKSKPVHLLSHPVTALLLNVGGMYVLYLTPLYSLTLTTPSLHHLVHIHFLLAGCLFVWAIAGPDPNPNRAGKYTRLAVLFLSMAAHAYLSKFMYAYSWPRNTPHDIEQIQEAAQLMYYGGDFAELLLAVAFFAGWYRRRKSAAYRLQEV
ncbi:cytochrome c oxidase assembly protein [Pontibacter rugosus]|uniref:Cytochrome c oxidase assembly protein n=1 Tax=Pontibacter rugosus TaxID=1745966 RepID=A0ABW3SXN4_9BACT